VNADGVMFYRVMVPPGSSGWVQADAVTGRFRRGDDERLAKLIQASEGFEQIERAMLFLETYPNSTLRPAILLLLGDLVEENAGKLSLEAGRRLNKREMAATGAPLHSFYLNYTSLDRYRKLGINFLFNSSMKTFHYDGEVWKEIIAKFPNASEATEAKKRIDSLKEKLERNSKEFSKIALERIFIGDRRNLAIYLSRIQRSVESLHCFSFPFSNERANLLVWARISGIAVDSQKSL
jgi:ribosomal protein L18E